MFEEIEPLITNEEPLNGNVNIDEKKQLTVDDVLLQTGPFGRYQMFLLFLCTIVFSGGFSFQALVTYYVADDSPWSCTNETLYDFCKKGPFREGTDLFAKRCHMGRDEWQYDYPKKYSFSTEFDLVCSKEYLKALSTALFFIGCCFGSIFSGPIADSFGRKPVICTMIFPAFLASLAGYFISAVWQYLLLRFVIGVTFGTLAPCVYIYLSENNSPKSRGWVCNIYFVGFTISMLIISMVAYLVQEWRKTLLFTSVMPFVAFLASFLLMESPHWLVAKGKIEEAEAVLMKIASLNKKQVNFCLVNNCQSTTTKKQYSYFYLFNSIKVFVLTSVQSVLWFGVGLVFYAIALESSNLGGSLYTNFILSSLSDLPGYIICMFSSMYIGRKKAASVSFIIGTVFFLALGFTPQHLTTLRVTFAILGRMVLAVSFNTLFLWTFEIYPTVIRSQGMNFSQMISRIGSTIAPFFTSVLQNVNPNLPYYIMAGVLVTCGLLSLLLPEMLHKPIREEYEELFDDRNVNVNSPVLSHVDS